jgi:lipocalin
MATSQADTGASSWHVRDRVEVGVSDVEVTLTPQPLGSLSGRVFFEGERPAPTADLFVSLRDEEGDLVRTEVSPEGSYSQRRLPAGRYEVTAGNADYIAAYFTGPDGARLPLTLTISPGETVHRDLTLTRAVSVIEGTAESAGVPQVGAFVLLMPKNPSERWAYRVDQTDSDGSYRLGTIPSGDYFLLALSDGNDVAYRDAKVAAILTKAAKPVHVDAGDHLEVKITY